jgi:hypothetical protein
MSEQFPVTVPVRRPDGSVEHVRVGTATRTADGFSLSLGELSIGARPDAAAPARAPAAAYAPAPRPSGGAPTNFPNYGRSKGAPISGASLTDLEYYANGCRRTLADPGKARFHDKERELLAVIEAELAAQGHGTPGEAPARSAGGARWSPPPEAEPAPRGGSGWGPPGDPEPPPLNDDDIPF